MERQNITRIKVVNRALEELAKQVVFVGGATVSLYSQRATGEIRPTDDVDVLVEIAHYGDYATIEEKLRKKGFVNDIGSGVLCRYTIQGITVDIMPTDQKILGFSNRWYPEAFANSMLVAINSTEQIRIFTAPYFVATKLEAFKTRGEKDGRTSTDFEDIVFLLNNRTSIWDEFLKAPERLNTYLKNEFTILLGIPYIEEWISSHIDFSEQNRTFTIVERLKNFCSRIN